MSEHSGRRGRPSREVVYERLDIQIAELWERLGGLPHPVEAQDIWRGLWFEEAHHSTAIEGNTLVLKQVEALLEQGRAVGNKELAEYNEVKGYADAADWVYNQAIRPAMTGASNVISLAELRHVHMMAMTPVWDVLPHPQATPREQPGALREHDIQPFPGGMTPPSWPLVAPEVDTWIERANSLEARSEGFPESLADLHATFERIHPFLDGNGRTGRLVLNLMLVRLGYPPAIIYKRQRSQYLGALRRACRSGQRRDRGTGAAHCSQPRAVAGGAGCRWRVAELQELGRRVPRQPLPPSLRALAARSIIDWRCPRL